MQITNDFTIPLPPAEAYELLLQVDKVAPCMPGTELGEPTDDGYEVTVTVKLGPMKFNYAGEVSIAESDDEARRAVLRGRARETRGQGTAEADITMVVSPHDEGSLVATSADVKLTGRAAQSGRGIVQDVSKRMIAQMADQIAVRYGTPAPAEDAADGTSADPAAAAQPAAPPVVEPKPISGGGLVLTVITGRLRALWQAIARRFGRSA